MATTFPVGVAIFPPTTQKVLASIKRAEQAGIPMAWVPSWPVGPDGMSIATAAAAQTSSIGLGTGISITYPCHPLTRANEAMVMAELAPQRFRLGVGASHQPAIEGQYGIKFEKPLAHMREYITVLRGLLWEGHIDFEGDYYRVHADFSPMMTPPPRFPIMMATLRQNMLRLAGEISDGAMLIWSPLSYVRSIALPALEEGARLANRSRPPLIVSAPIVLTTDFGVVRQVAHAAFSVYKSFPTYKKLFQEAGYPLAADGELTDELIHELFLYGDEDTIRQRLYAMHAAGVDEVMTALSPLANSEHEERTILEILASI
ncbi:LLM class F420-dependent oxidoreductase [Dictyobacter vulcani]|uniref:LLM class F420-dependent oxidoreductase n=1 Tax=Dictyobacter vulcani TaxID=2607529 RepID=A0A5J4KY02_9CHLR|nr:LLM class flavin-dependent oxidoreductase [Dictyobacter vulcani]GER90016.1 LLM class F420-dependent oxidoreductase [Dictyobacter vulcani]